VCICVYVGATIFSSSSSHVFHILHHSLRLFLPSWRHDVVVNVLIEYILRNKIPLQECDLAKRLRAHETTATTQRSRYGNVSTKPRLSLALLPLPILHSPPPFIYIYLPRITARPAPNLYRRPRPRSHLSRRQGAHIHLSPTSPRSALSDQRGGADVDGI